MFLLYLLGFAIITYFFCEYILKSQKHFNKIFFTLLICSFIFSWLTQHYGTTTIGSFIERAEYKANYYVNLFPNEKSSKNYRVKANIFATKLEYTESDNDGNSYTSKERAYFIERAYLPNGGSISFQKSIEALEEDYALKLGQKIQVQDDNGKDWWIELTDEKAD